MGVSRRAAEQQDAAISSPVCLSTRHQSEPDPDEQLSRAQAAKLLNVAVRTLERWDAEGILVPARLGRKILRYSRRDLIAFCQSRPRERAVFEAAQ
jgi:DNA-binding transcriptional regulator YiaG